MAAVKASATVREQRVSALRRLNSDGLLITRNYVLPTPAPVGAPEHNLALSNASPSIPFLFRCPDPQLARQAFRTELALAYGSCLTGVSMSDPVSHPARSDRLEICSRSHRRRVNQI